jgi:Cu+-exporting ATPase
MDKTGTLTEGKPKLVSIQSFNGYSDIDALRIAASLEKGSEHPLASAVLKGAAERGITDLPVATNFQSITGKGVQAKVENKMAAIGNSTLMTDLAVDTASITEKARGLQQQGQTVLFLGIDNTPAALFGVADPIKMTTPEAIAQLKSQGLHLVMLTGDNAMTAQAVAAALGIEEVYAGVLPEQKSEVIRKLKSTGRSVAMAGDGVNDAPALALADVGIAMGSGTDVAMQSAGITLVRGDLRGIVRARNLSKRTLQNIRQNLFFAFVYNILGVPIAAGVLYPFVGLLLSPMIASAAMSFSSVSVIANALRLRKASI